MRTARSIVALAISAMAGGCDMLDMYDERRFEPLEASSFYENGSSARPLVAGTVARGELREDEALYTGKVEGKLVEELPLEIDRELLSRGQERFNIYCSPCHGRVGDGFGMIVERGFRRPPTYHIDRLRQAPVGHFYDVISNGFGAMPSYASRIEPRDRWAIAAYIRVLQRSQNAQLDDVPEEERDQIAEAVEEQLKRRAADVRRDTREQRALERDLREHRRPPEEGERRHREIERQDQCGVRSAECGMLVCVVDCRNLVGWAERSESHLHPDARPNGGTRCARPTLRLLHSALRTPHSALSGAPA